MRGAGGGAEAGERCPSIQQKGVPAPCRLWALQGGERSPTQALPEELHLGLEKISPAVNNYTCLGESRRVWWGPRLGGPPGGGHTLETLESFFRG